MVDPIQGPVVVLTGAGISAESDVPTFRGKGVVWRNFRSQELATPEDFCRDPATVWEGYDWRRGLVGLCVPNAAHETLVEMKREQDQFNWKKEEGTSC